MTALELGQFHPFNYFVFIVSASHACTGKPPDQKVLWERFSVKVPYFSGLDDGSRFVVHAHPTGFTWYDPCTLHRSKRTTH
ncbi:hypothetical protein BO71DRAFT_400793 [Aspergillus ellipticus CBS 707.79]|uniref:Uncharacterized protein n=1 Tax=Aspergillus ellipticus CBS 707.79 TaxID=1448320 RepID=A0A319DLJ9_9EURO|nr:hypothetical protein BO71DRAFT_400793 [Aspergillus ellipticus CBS 707.79]